MPDVETLMDRVPVDRVAVDSTGVDRVVEDVASDGVSEGGSIDDGAMDGGDGGDGATDSAVMRDGAFFDVPNPIDVQIPTDVPIPDGMVIEDVMRPGFCDMPSTLRVCTTDGDCDRPSQRCLPTGCGSIQRCQPAGRGCRDNADCLAGVQTCNRGVCVATGADCGDSRGCPDGYACEGPAGARRCVNRRRECDGTIVACPYGGVCEGVPGLAPFCVGVTSRCASDEACRRGSSCRDVDGDRLNECVPSGPCMPGVCAPSDRCEILPVDYFLVCGPRGICNPTIGCAAGYECVDVWSSGVFECRPTSEPCRTNAQCPEGQLCFEAGGAGLPMEPAGCR